MKAIVSTGRFLGKYFALFVLAGAVISYFQPNLILWVLPYVSLLLGLIMFGMGVSLKRSDFAAVFKRPKDVIVGVCAHYLIMPLVAYALCLAFHLPNALAVGVILVGCCPSGTASNVMCYLAKGDVALGVSIGAVSTLIAPVMLPLILWLLAGRWVRIPTGSLFISVIEIVILPIVLGVLVHTFGGNKVEKGAEALPLVSTIAIILIASSVVAANHASLFAASTLILIPVVMLHNLLGFALGFFFSRLLGMNHPKSRSITFEVGMQNSALGVSLAMAFFSPAAAIPGTFFSVWHNMSGSVLASYWASRGKKGKVPVVEAVQNSVN
ncbi:MULTISPECIES: bile acid:sodium symporter family protein [unclassified Sporolactobacillus]|uniref:bile acid:sodium symporter family protein n=1 Tax=unclassified Sporolactobacillus TaxID=2628533 RepID=UPI002368A415|nr:bile acid:sodium symporter family protein [Sporolactobacillus sp. CQH2019]MDD9148308.1 bile acid:sodium symporter family protein [Sporolactobacillus sp. CQH2019]